MNDSLRDTLLVAAGGALGTIFRHGINVWTHNPDFPLGTMIENLSGALALGLVVGFITARPESKPWLRHGVAVGLWGGYTTMSTFAADTILIRFGQAPEMVIFYVGITLLFGIVLAALGMSAGKSLGLYFGDESQGRG